MNSRSNRASDGTWRLLDAAVGYIVNDDTFLFIKYMTKERSPWRFTFDQEDIDRCVRMESEYRRVVFGFVCGSDGICTIGWAQACELLDMKPGWIAAARKHNHSYSVWGANGELSARLPSTSGPVVVEKTKKSRRTP